MTLPIDKQIRTYGFNRAAERDATLLEPEPRKYMEAYARGIKRIHQPAREKSSLEIFTPPLQAAALAAFRYAVISAYMYRTLTDTWEREIEIAPKVTERAGAERAKDLFSADCRHGPFRRR